MELKWPMIAMAVIFGGGMFAASVGEYQKGQCKIAYVQSAKTAEEINRICK